MAHVGEHGVHPADFRRDVVGVSGPARDHAFLHAVCRLQLLPLVADHPDLDGLHFRLLAVPARLGTQRPPAPEGARAGAGVRGHHDRHDPRLLRGRARQPRLRLFQPGAAPEARPHRLLLDGIRGAGLHDVRGHRLVDQPGVARGARGPAVGGAFPARARVAPEGMPGAGLPSPCAGSASGSARSASACSSIS